MNPSSIISTIPIRSPGRIASLIGPPRNHLTAETNSSGVEAGLKPKLRQQKTLVSLLKGFLVQQHLVEPQQERLESPGLL